MSATYVLPIRRDDAPAPPELSVYLHWLSTMLPVIVVDGSPRAIFAAHASAWRDVVQHVPVDADLLNLKNGKVAGVLTGVRHARHDALILADDDVRHDAASLAALVRALDSADVVRPQNFFAPLPWHAAWDSGRILVNRALDGDWPGTLAVRRSALLATHGYSGSVLFENLELVRTVVAAGGREHLAREILVRRLPPSSRHFWKQRVRQAYDEFARPWRLVAQLALFPTLALLSYAGEWFVLAGGVVMVIALAEGGRRRDGGRRCFRAWASMLAPLWVLERSVTAWLALATRIVHGGVAYAGGRLARAATSPRELARRHGGALTPARSPASPRRRSA